MIRFRGQVWRILPQGQDPLMPVTSPEGRFHHSGQRALYASLTPEGTVVAIRRYLGKYDPPRVIVPLMIAADMVADLRGGPEASVVWQDIRAADGWSPTWAFSDVARRNGAEAMLYSSRSRPDITHCVLFVDPITLITAIGSPTQADPLLGGV